MTQWRYWLIDLPSTITEVGMAWFRLYFFLVTLVAAITGPALVLAMLILWFGFGIRWGW